jgi:asparagine synthase (glutamine-hydrolysing)
MFRYLAFLWNDRDPGPRAAARTLRERHGGGRIGWRTVFGGRGIEVRCAGERAGSSAAYRLAEGGGVVLGKLFARSEAGSSPAPSQLDEWSTRLILDSDGRHLIEGFWGRYVAFLHDADGPASWVLRDPSAGLPCYLLRVRGVDLYFSLIEDVLELADAPLQVNWPHLVAGLSYPREHCRATALLEVTQVLAGECVKGRAGDCRRSFYWDPLAIASTEVLEDPQEAAGALARCVREVVHAWAGSYEGILLSLSGGLGSSIVLACLAQMHDGPRVECFHHYPLGADLDERGYARLAAARTPFALLERPRAGSLDLRPLLAMRAMPEPANHPYYLEHSRDEATLAAERAADGIFSGYGGDRLFYRERAEWALGDFLSRRGLRPGAWSVALDSARMDQISLWRVLRRAASSGLGQHRWSALEEAGRLRPLLAPEALAEARHAADFLHPLLRHPRGTPSGKLWHAHQITMPFDFYDPIGAPGDAERVAPLCSQPLMELALRIPTYVLMRGGWDRATARRAFYRELPPEIRNRTDKGAMEELLRLTLDRNRAFLRELLLDGELVRQRIVQRAKLAEALSGSAIRVGAGTSELLEYAGTEAWLRCWRGRMRRAAA